jgi:hypothetical protein
VSVFPVPFIAQYAARKGLKYQPEADERWLRVWEPYTTLKVPFRYEHVLEATGDSGSLTIARFVVHLPPRGQPQFMPEAGAWIAIVQDPRILQGADTNARVAATSDIGSAFAESLDLVSLPRRQTGDGAFDHVFASFAASDEDLARAMSPSLRKLVLSWKAPVHVELRPGGFIVAPVALRADADSLAWLVRVLPIFGDKAAKLSST